MAWNPTPEVAVARDAAARLGECAKTTVEQVVVLYVTQDGRMGYASYGTTRELCADAKKLADVVYKGAYRHFANS